MRILTNLTLLFLISMGALSGCKQWSFDRGSEPVDRLALYMESRYRRELYRDRFSLDYTARPPQTIVIQARYYPDANGHLMNELIGSAREIIEHVSREKFDMPSIVIVVEMKTVDFPKKESEQDWEWVIKLRRLLGGLSPVPSPTPPSPHP